MTRYSLSGPDGPIVVDLLPAEEGYRVVVEGAEYTVKVKRGGDPESVVAEISGKPVTISLVRADGEGVDMILAGERMSFRKPSGLPAAPAPPPPREAADRGLVSAPMPGRVMGAIVKQGEKVKKGDPLVILESMKMEVAVRADRDGQVTEILAGEGTAVKRGQALVRLT